MESIRKITAEIEEYNRKGNVLRAKLRQAHMRKQLTCVHCKKRTKVGNLTYIQVLTWENEPYNERWDDLEGVFECPKCGKMNKNRNNPLIEELKYYFKDEEKVYDRDLDEY